MRRTLRLLMDAKGEKVIRLFLRTKTKGWLTAHLAMAVYVCTLHVAQRMYFKACLVAQPVSVAADKAVVVSEKTLQALLYSSAGWLMADAAQMGTEVYAFAGTSDLCLSLQLPVGIMLVACGEDEWGFVRLSCGGDEGKAVAKARAMLLTPFRGEVQECHQHNQQYDNLLHLFNRVYYLNNRFSRVRGFPVSCQPLFPGGRALMPNFFKAS